MPATPRLRRHQLAHLTRAGWAAVLDRPLPDAAAAMLATWAQRGLPLVVTRQACAAPDEIALGWPAPPACGRVRLPLQVAAGHIAWLDEFPHARGAAPLVPRASRSAYLSLVEGLQRQGARPHVYGSYGWQMLTGLPYLHAKSDLDLWLPVGTQQQADAAVALLQSQSPAGLRIDGELMFPGGAGVNWREYAAWRSGAARSLLVKRIDSVDLDLALALPEWAEAA